MRISPMIDFQFKIKPVSKFTTLTGFVVYMFGSLNWIYSPMYLLKTATDSMMSPVSLATALQVRTLFFSPPRLQFVSRLTFLLRPMTSMKGWSIRKSTDLSSMSRKQGSYLLDLGWILTARLRSLSKFQPQYCSSVGRASFKGATLLRLVRIMKYHLSDHLTPRHEVVAKNPSSTIWYKSTVRE